MNYTGLSLAQTPPLAAPARFMLTAPLFAAVAGLLLAASGAELTASRWTPPFLAVTHLLTLGFAAMVMFGAVQQILPVLAGSPVPRPNLTSLAIHLPLTLGTLCLAGGLLTGDRVLLFVALGLLAFAIILFVGVALYCLLRARSAHATVRAMLLAVLALAVTITFGLDLAAGHAVAAMEIHRQFTATHIAWGFTGWIALLIIGVAYQVVPMFQITPDYPRLMTRLLAPVLFGALVLRVIGEVAPLPPLTALGEGVLMAGLGAFGLATLRLQQQRRRRLPDVTVDYWRLSMGGLLGAVALWGVGYFMPGDSVRVLAGMLFLLGFTMGAISGMLYKILPFLVWLHLNNRLQGAGRWQGRVPNMRQIIPEKRQRWQFRTYVLAVALCIAALLIPALSRTAGLALAVAMLFLAWNLFGALRLFRRVTMSAEVSPG